MPHFQNNHSPQEAIYPAAVSKAEKKLIDALPPTITIRGEWEGGLVYVNGALLNHAATLKHRNHSPSGFSWGFLGSGPAQLSLAILLRFMPTREALTYYQAFKENVVAGWPQRDVYLDVPLQAALRTIVSDRK